MTIFVAIFSHGLAVHNHMAPALGVGELIAALAGDTLTFVELPLLETTHDHVLSEQNVEGGVDLLQGVITDENQCVEAFQNHANLRSRIPAVMTANREVRLLETVTTASAHSVEERGPVLAVKRMFGDIVVVVVKWTRRLVDFRRFDTTVPVAFKV